MPSRKLEDLHPVLVEAYTQSVEEYEKTYPNSPQPFITCTHRSNEEQTALYAQGRTKPGAKVTWVTAGNSAHNYLPALAFDIAFLGLDKKLDWNPINFSRFAKIFLAKKGATEWGGNWLKGKDAPHFQLKDWRNYIAK